MVTTNNPDNSTQMNEPATANSSVAYREAQPFSRQFQTMSVPKGRHKLARQVASSLAQIQVDGLVVTLTAQDPFVMVAVNHPWVDYSHNNEVPDA